LNCIYCKRNYAIEEYFKDGILYQEGNCNCEGSQINAINKEIKRVGEKILSYKSI